MEIGFRTVLLNLNFPFFLLKFVTDLVINT